MGAAIYKLICFLFGHLDTGVFKDDCCRLCGLPAVALCRLCGSHYLWRTPGDA
jgi:hypothetical protein